MSNSKIDENTIINKLQIEPIMGVYGRPACLETRRYKDGTIALIGLDHETRNLAWVASWRYHESTIREDEVWVKSNFLDHLMRVGAILPLGEFRTIELDTKAKFQIYKCELMI